MEDNQQNDERVLASLKAKAQLAGALREMAQTPGFAWLKNELNNRLNDLRHEWIKASDVDSAKIKARAAAYNEIFDVIKATIMVGDQAASAIRRYEEESGERQQP